MEKQKNFSTIGFILGSIGAAVGLGNIWRFPKEMVTAGGSSFILVYVIVLALIAFPIILLEMRYGLFFKNGAVSCFKHAGKEKAASLGWTQITVTMFSCVYYLAIISWIFVAFFYTLIPGQLALWGNNETFFKEKILQLPEEGNNTTFSYLTLLSFIVLLVFLFVVLYLGVKKGIEKTNLILVPALFFILIGLTIYSLLQNNVGIALNKLFEFKSESFVQLEVWRKATIQVMFSTGILFGTYMILGKNSNIKIDKGNDALIIISADTFTGILSGILITTTVANSYTGTSSEVTKELDEFFSLETAGGSSLIFVELPKIFQNINEKVPYLGQILLLLFIITLLFAAFSSIIFLIEVWVDSVLELFPNVKRGTAVMFWTIFAILQYLVFVRYNQVKMVDFQDAWINQLILTVGCFEIILFITYKKYDKIMQKNDEYSYIKATKYNWLKHLLMFVTFPVILLVTVWGFLKLFDLDYYIFQNASESFKRILNIQDKTLAKIEASWNEPAKIYTISTVIFMILMPLLLWILSKKRGVKPITNE